MRILAVDLGKFNSVWCLLDTVSQETRFDLMATHCTYLESLLRVLEPELVVVEACAIAGWVHDLCREHGRQVLVANPSQEAWKWKNLKRKTDRDDALKLAKLAALGQLVPVHMPSHPMRQYRRLVKYRKTLVGRINRVQNNIRALFASQGLAVPRGHRAWTAAGLHDLGRYRKPLADCTIAELWRGELDLELRALDELRAQHQAVDEHLERLGKHDSRVQLLQTIPGVARKTAEVIVTCLDDPRRFQSGRQVSAYAGLVPRQFQSGEMNRQGRITRRGPRRLRAALVEAAWCMLRYNAWAAETYMRIHAGQKTRKKQALVAVARKLLVRSWAMLLHNEPWREQGTVPKPTA